MAAHVVPTDKEEKKAAAGIVEGISSRALKEKSSSASKTSEKSIRVKPFARAAHKMITKLNETHPSVASWSESGDMIVIRNKKDFVQHLPKFFNTNQYESFSKQLNVYGFKQIGPEWEIINGTPQLISRSAPTPGIRHNENIYRFWHPHFHRDGKDQLHKVLPAGKTSAQSCKTVRKTGISQREDAEEDDPSEDAELLRARVAFLKNEIENMKRKMDEKVLALEQRYKAGVRKLSRELETACARRLEEQSRAMAAPIPIFAEVVPKQVDVNVNESKGSNKQSVAGAVADANNVTKELYLDAPDVLFRDWSNLLPNVDESCDALRESPMDEWPPPDLGIEKCGRMTTFELSEPILFQEEGLNDCTLQLNYAEI